MSEVKLKPCPFCGDEAQFVSDETREVFDGLEIKGAAIYCENCCAEMFYVSADLAIKAWNRRTPENPSEINENAPNSGENNSGE